MLKHIVLNVKQNLNINQPQQVEVIMKKYRKKPVVIEAVKWTGQNHRDMFNFLFDGENPDEQAIRTEGKNFYISHGLVHGGLVIKTMEGEHIASIGDYIIKGIKGEFYPCKPDIFEQTYDKV